MGSCFSGYFYQFLKNLFFPSMISPFGNTYNPFSIARTLSMIAEHRDINENEVFEYNGLYRHFLFHTEICSPDKALFISLAHKMIGEAASFLKKTTVLVITFGTAFAYFHGGTDNVVNNCHSLPASTFNRKLLSVDEITEKCMAVLKNLRQKYPDLFIIFTLSPVRHLRDHARENSLSKAVLRCAIENLLSLPDTYYFPSYEIVLDELRDYRFYGHDLCHPGETAVCYIMKRFCESCFTGQANDYMKKIIQLRKDLSHKPRHPETEQYREFLKVRENHLHLLRLEYPDMVLPESIEDFFKE